nr:GMC family oxidoreductase [Sphingobium jiangsuense]
MRRSPAVSTVVCLARPQSRGRLSLRSADPLAPPVIRHELLGVEDDVDQIMDGIRHVRRILDHPLMRGYITEDVRPDRAMEGEALRAYVHLAGFPLYHPVGTCRIGGEEDGVVDADLRLRGVEGLWVADASVMPMLPVGNTNATAIMIGDKGAAHVIASLGK